MKPKILITFESATAPEEKSHTGAIGILFKGLLGKAQMLKEIKLISWLSLFLKWSSITL